MNFFQAIRSCFKKFATGHGRASRSEFWYWNLFSVIVSIIATVIDLVFFPGRKYWYGHYGPTEILVDLTFLMPFLAVCSRRLHDINKSGMWYLISMTIVGLIPLLYWWCKKGDAGDNRYGSPVTAPSGS
jgi:uncharacterized membrane protein YhaH (DUF805 family)